MSTLLTPPPIPVRPAHLDLPDLRLHYVTLDPAGPAAANGRPVVLLHGYSDSWRSLALVMPGLASLGRVVALDQRGHGASAYAGPRFAPDNFAADAAAVIEHLAAGPAVVVGHSMGSLVARALARSRPELVDKLILIGTLGRLDRPAMREMGDALAAFDGPIPRAFVAAFQAGCVYDGLLLPPGFLEARIDDACRTPPHTWRAAWRHMLAHDDTPLLGGIRTPTLVIGGRHDAIFPADEQADVARALPRARLALYDGCGHSPPWEHPRRVVADVVAFVREPAGR